MKRFLSFLLIFALLVMAVPPATFAEEERQSGLYTYRVRGNGTLTITKFDWYQNKGDIYIPNMIDGYTVTEIGAEAFSRGDEDLLCLNSTDPFSLHFGLIPQPVTLTLPDTITTIGNLAFFNTPIKSIIIPESVEQIGAGAFAGCVNIERFSVSASNSTFTTIDDALYNKKTKTLIAYPIKEPYGGIPDGIVKIGDYAFFGKDFDGRYFLYKIPQSIREIGDYAYAYCTIQVSTHNLDLEYLPNNLETIGNFAFYNSTIDSRYEREFRIPASVKKIGDYAFANFENDGEKITFAENAKLEIGDSCFLSAEACIIMENIAEVSVKDYAFSNVRSEYDDIKIPLDKLTNLSKGIFSGTEWVRFAPWEIPGRFEVIPESAFEGSNSFRYTIESGIREIGKKAFRGCSKLDELTLPDTLETIEEEAFAACPRLKTATIPETVTFIGDSAFDKDTITLIVEEGSYAETWARDNGYIYQYTDSDDLSWLNN